MRVRIALVATVLVGLTASPIQAAPILYVNDSGGNLGTVDVANGNVNVIGNTGVVLTDIAFSPTGQLFGLSFTTLYSINATTAVATPIGAHNIPGGNALVFGTNGTLYGAGASSNQLFTLDPNTGAGMAIGSVGALSSGDLAFNGGDLFLSSTTNELIQIDLGPPASGMPVGPFGFGDVFGLATAENGVLYGVSGTNVLSVNPGTGAGTFVVDYSGQGLGTAFGSAFISEAQAVPEPASLTLFGIGLAGMAGYRLRRNRRSTVKV